MNVLYNMDYGAKFVIALIFVLTPVIIFFGIRVVAANICSKKAKLLNMNSNKWEILAFIVPVISMIAIYNIGSISKLHVTITKWGIITHLTLKISGWILTIIGGILSAGALISMTKPDFTMDGIMLLSILSAVIILIIGLLILKKTK